MAHEADLLNADISTDGLYFLRITKYSKVASCALALYEILSTLPDEIAFIWPTRMTAMKVVYFVNKYSIVVDLSLTTTAALWTQDSQICARQFQALAYSYVCGTLVSESILVTRTMAIWRYNKYLVAFLIGGFLEIAGFALYTVYHTTAYTDYPSNDTLRITECVPSTQDQDAWPAYMCLIIGETAIIILTFLRRYLDNHGVNSQVSSQAPLIDTMYRDGSLFYLVVLAMSTCNLVVMLSVPEDLSSSMQMPLRVIHSALCTRVLLNLRSAAAATSSIDGYELHSTLAFAPHCSESLGHCSTESDDSSRVSDSERA
ncbi:hypothetical protein C8Q80DRAFT_785614 [Daedaleopsis nitida]|nr:hypothetical protein C8Q80DRAFT_785614 [Daedaleopsis nitida]